MNNNFLKQLRRVCAFWALRTISLSHGAMPLGWSCFWGKVLGEIICFVLPRHVKVAYESLSIAFPQASRRDKRRMTREFFVFMTTGGLEMVYYMCHLDKLTHVRIEGRQHLDAALKQDRGVMVVTAHLGNFPLMGLKLAQEGYPVNFVARPMRDENAESYIDNLRVKAGVKTIPSYPRRECVNGIVSALRRNELVIIQMDQNFGTSGVWVKFFGSLAATPTGPIVFAMRTKAVMLPMYIHRGKKASHCIEIMPPQELIVKEDKDEMILANVIKFTHIIEDWIRQYPSQWSWIHRRWKSRPTETEFLEKFKVEV